MKEAIPKQLSTFRTHSIASLDKPSMPPDRLISLSDSTFRKSCFSLTSTLTLHGLLFFVDEFRVLFNWPIQSITAKL